MSPPVDSVAAPTLRLHDPTELVSRNWIDLCQIVSGSSLTLFGFVNVTKHALQALAEKTVERLRNWHNGLPPELQVELGNGGGDYVPHVLLLQMQYHQFMIFIHRPFISKYRSQPYPPVGPGYNHARTTCIESAVAISKLLTKYKSAYTLRFINIQAVSIVFSAALILVFATVSEIRGDANVDLNIHLSTCCKGLAELGKTFQNATRALEVLLSIKRAWQAKLLVYVGSKRRSSSIKTHRGSAKKRTTS
ncbi:hypothetical protein BKA65DRAFT_515922 [Rhexocercosporidium sp. MPI-PUGE-AT-0058]|nr:hypothetical protein BKA65DRAFT_515922 [Rhexocercosporidium sp. MPI-PUGE-AT-0058]